MLGKIRTFYKKDECEKQYKLGKTLGSGSFATVKEAEAKEDSTQWAVKIIAKEKMDKEDRDALATEVAILERVDHPNIVQLREVFDCPKTFYMVMEKMTGGELFDRIVKKEKYTEEEAKNVVRKLGGALQYCHAMGIVHRDLKPENLLYTSEADDAEIKIADFGLAKLLGDSQLMATACGTPGYVAPEILEGLPYTDKVDIWSIGVITYILLCGFPPFYDENNAALFAAIKAGAYEFTRPYWDDISDLAKQFVSDLLVVDPRRRLSAEEMLAHRWLNSESEGKAADMSSALKEMRKYNVRRRFQASVRRARIVKIFERAGAGAKARGDASSIAAMAMAAAAESKSTEEGAAEGGGGGSGGGGL